MMTHFVYGPVRQGAMQIALKNGGIHLTVDLDVLDAFLRLRDTLGDQRIGAEIANMLHHELAHILLGHLDGVPEEFADPLMILAKEIAVNDGWLQLGETVYPFVRLFSLPYGNKMLRYAEENGFPEDWLQNYFLVYQALGSVAPKSYVVARAKLAELWKELNPNQIQDFAPGPDEMLVLVVYYEGKATVYPVVFHHATDPSDVKDVHEAVRHELLDSGEYQYDQTTGSYRYSPQGFQEHERILKMKSYRVPWHIIRRLFGVKRTLGYDRRKGHLYPPDEMPLVTKRFDRKTVHVFYDSSGSIPDEVLGRFIGTVHRSPFKVVERYFSTEIRNEPHTGGTDFKCIEEYLLEMDSYPDTIVVLTDGYATANFTPKYPERWYWIVRGDPSVPRQIGGTVIEIQEQESVL
jgi:hypothetical protein